MSKPLLPAAAAAALILSSCMPPEAPPPRFNPNPPYPPQPVDPYGETTDPNNGQATDSYGQSTDPAPEQPARPGEYPTARKTANPNEVISPYEPYNVIDVEGFQTGQLARDPSNKKIFRVP